MAHDDRRRRFELLALPHLDAAYNLARWLARNPSDAEDVVQDAYLRAFRYFDTFQGGNFRVWLLTIVRNAFVNLGEGKPLGPHGVPARYARRGHRRNRGNDVGQPPRDPEALLLESIDSRDPEPPDGAVAGGYREVLLLREVEDLAYKEIATVTGVPIGTVMSRLARARLSLRNLWLRQAETENAHGV